MCDQNEKDSLIEEPCDCCMPDCDECSQRLIDQEEESMMDDSVRDIEEQEERELQRQLEGGDGDDNDEEDMHGSHPIDDPDEDEDEDQAPPP